MPIKIKVDWPLMCPMFFCDVCGEEIRDYQRGVYVYDGFTTKTDHPGELFFVHRGNCHRIIDEEFRSRNWYPNWNELDKFLVFLVHNTGIKNFNQVKRKVDF